MKPSSKGTPLKVLLPLVLVLLVAAVLRWAALPEMSDMLNFDESFYAIDALSLLESPRFTPFFEGNTGRQSAWMYILALFFLGLGPTPFAARLAATFVSLLTVAAAYQLGRALLGRVAAVGAAAAMATLYLPVHFGHIAFRANLLPLLGALSLVFLLAAIRRGRLAFWVATGVTLGLMSYSYISAYLWMVVCGAVLVAQIVFHPQRRRGAGIALGLALALSLPLAAYVVQQPGALLQRPNEVSRTDLNALVGAIQAWAGAWLSRGDIFHNHNIPGRPLLDWASAALVLLGIAQLAWLRRYRKAGAALAGLALISILPSLLSETPPHFLRSIGLTVPVTLVMGAGAEGIVSFGTRLSRAASNLRHAQAVLGVGARLAPVALFAAVATKTYVDFHGTWLRLPELETQFERRVLQATEVLRQNSRETPSGTPVYFVQKGLWHPIVRFSQYRLPMFRVAAFEMPTCLAVSAEREGIYVDLSLTRKALVHALSAWGEVAAFHPSQPDLLRFLPNRAALLAEGDAQAQFGAQVEVRAHPADLPARVSPGARLSWLMRFRLHQPTGKAYALFVHLYKIDPSEEVDDTHKFAQGDRWLCPPYPTPFWQPDEVVVQPFELTLPDDLPAGDYAIAVGVYDQASGERLTLPEWKSYFVLHRLSVVR